MTSITGRFISAVFNTVLLHSIYVFRAFALGDFCPLWESFLMVSSVGDPNPDPLDLHVFGPPDPLVRGMDPDPYLLSSKNSKKNLDFYCFVTSFWLFTFEKWCKSTFKKLYAINLFLIIFLLASWRSMMKIEGSGSASGSISQETWIRGSGSGSTPKCHGSATLMVRVNLGCNPDGFCGRMQAWCVCWVSVNCAIM